jgi:protease-4
VWTGIQAKQLGLVDELGGFYLAVDRAKQLAGIKGAARLVGFDVETSPFEALQRLFGAGAQATRVLSLAAQLSQDANARAIIDAAEAARLRGEGATVLAPVEP